MQSRNIAYIPEIDHLRLLAALLVFGYHYFHYFYGNWQALPNLAPFGLITEGHTGVSLFFVLSGFIFTRIAWNAEAIRYGSFLRNRILRILPLFTVVFIVAISVGRNHFEASDLLYFFLTNIGDAPTSWHIITGPAWSISVEFAFYLVFPFLALFAKREGPIYLFKLIGLLLVIKVGAYLASDASKHMIYSTLIGRFDQFLIGMLAAMAYQKWGDRLERVGLVLLAGSLLAIYLAVSVQAGVASFQGPEQRDPFWILWPTVEACLWAAVVVAYLVARLPWPQTVSRALALGGTISFSFYMWHALVIFTVHSLFGGASSAFSLFWMGLPVLAAAGGVAWLSYVTIERPFLLMRSQYSRPTAVAAKAAG